MSLFPLALKPGIYRNSTEYDSKGRWYDSSLVRFYEGSIIPEGGWRVKSTSAMTGMPRAIITWASNDSTTRAAIGTHSKLYAMSRAGVMSNITPAGFTAGRADAVAGGGYGGSLYGGGAYGIPTIDSTSVLEASMWTLDTFGENLVGCMPQDGKLYEWTLVGATPAAAIAGAPTAEACFVTEEGMLVALGAAGVKRRVQWSDQRVNTTWTAAASNQAGDYDLQTNGVLLQGVRVREASLIHTSLDLWRMSYTADNSVYSIVKVGDGCGSVSRGASISLDNQAVWMGYNGFWSYNGFVVPLPCDVWNYVFGDINLQQASKITAEMNTAFGEVCWPYCSGGSTEIDRKVVWNFRENHWRVEHVASARLAGTDKGVFQYTLRVASNGYVYEHDVGYSYGGILPYLESGPVEVGNGDNVQHAVQLLPDERTQGQVSLTFKVKFAPEDTETSFGPYTLSRYTDVRFGFRQVRYRYDGVAASDWIVGTPRLDLTASSKR